MFLTLLATMVLMALAGLPHCAAMCATPCAVALPRGVSPAVLTGRTLGYAALGGLAAGATGLLARWSQWSAALAPLWVMLLAATVIVGGWMLAKGAVPPVIERHGMQAYRWLQGRADSSILLQRQPWLGPVLPALLGAAWAALPCGLLYGALMVAALAERPSQGAVLMAAFSLPGGLALWWLPRRMRGWTSDAARSTAHPAHAARMPVARSTTAARPVIPILALPSASPMSASLVDAGEPLQPDARWSLPGGALAPRLDHWLRLADPRWSLRLSGAMLSVAAAWALVHRLTMQWQAWCA